MRRPTPTGRALGLPVLALLAGLGVACGGDAGDREGDGPDSGSGALSAPQVSVPDSSNVEARGAGSSADGTVSVTGAFALDPLGNEQLAFYAVLTNRAPSGDTLIAVSSPWAASGSLHTMAEADGMMRMRPVPAIPVSPQSAVRLEPGALHGMLEGLFARPSAGEAIEITFEFSGSGPIVVRVPVLHPADAHTAADEHQHP